MKRDPPNSFTGLPNTNYFPFDTLEARAALPNRWKPTSNQSTGPPTAQPTDATLSSDPPSAHVLVPKNSGSKDALKKIDLAGALQYGTAQGYPPLYSFVRQFALEYLHPHIPYKGGAEVILTCGSTDGFAKAIEALNNPWSEEKDAIEEKEGLLVEEYCYMNAVQTARPRGMNIVPVKIDGEGMRASGKGGLKDVLENWDFSRGRRPHLMYTVTIGQNPTSGVLSVERRKEIYALCVQYDIVIIEDEPYWYLQYISTRPESPSPAAKPTGFRFLDSLIPSYLSIDYQGRVVRLDTFSKTAAPGCRLGWLTAQPALVERILRITETSTQQPSGFAQSMIAELIVGPQGRSDGGRGGAKNGSGWKVDGWVRWLEGLRGNYERRMNIMCNILDAGKHIVKAGRRNSLFAATESQSLEDGWSVIETMKMYDFVRPLGGMFVWVRFDFSVHPLSSKVPMPRLAHAQWVFWTKEPYRVLVSPGTIFAPTDEIRERDGWKCFRLCFAAVGEDELKSISRRFARGAKAFFRIKDFNTIDELLKEDDQAEGESCCEVQNLSHPICIPYI